MRGLFLLTMVMVGDRPETDGLFARTLGCPYALVRSGVVAPGADVADDIPVALDVADLSAVARVLAAPPTGAG